MYVQTFYWEVEDKNKSKMWSLALQKLTSRWKMAPVPSRLWAFMEEAQIKGIGCLEEDSSRPGESEEPPMKYGTQKEL